MTALLTENSQSVQVATKVQALSERDELRRIRQIRALRQLLRRAAELENGAT